MRPCEEACPVFVRELRLAVAQGLKVIACRVHWHADGRADFLGQVPVDL